MVHQAEKVKIKKSKWSTKGREILPAIDLLKNTRFSWNVPRWYNILDAFLAGLIVLTMVGVYTYIALWLVKMNT